MDKLKLYTKKKAVTRQLWEVEASIQINTSYHDKEGRIFFSPPCVSPTEINALADALIRNLEKIKKHAGKLKWDNHPSMKNK